MAEDRVLRTWFDGFQFGVGFHGNFGRLSELPEAFGWVGCCSSSGLFVVVEGGAVLPCP